MGKENIVAADTATAVNSAQNLIEDSMWPLIIGAVSLLVIVAIVISIIRVKKSVRLKKKGRVLADSVVDYDNIISSSFNAKCLYDALKGKCHPDKFADEEMNAVATEIFQQLVNCKYDYKKLCELKEITVNKLHIKL